MKTKSEAIGKDISAASVVDISPFGIWLHVRNVEYFLAYDQFPWFRDAPVSSVFEVCVEGEDSLRWPALDVDLTLDAIAHPERYPLVFEEAAMVCEPKSAGDKP